MYFKYFKEEKKNYFYLCLLIFVHVHLLKHVFEMNFVILALYGVFLLISKYVLGLGFKQLFLKNSFVF
jgi:hypothetical protein